MIPQRVRPALVAAAALLGACRAAPPESPDAAVASGQDGAQPDGYRFVADAAARAQAAGASAPELLATGAGAPGDRITRVLRVPDESCALLMVRSSESVSDADLFAYGEDGTVLGTDESPAKPASVIVCPPHPRHVYVVARIASGHGIVAVAAQMLSPDTADSVGEAVGARGRPGRSATTASAWPGLDDAIAQHRRAIGGTWRDIRRAAMPADPRVVSRLSVPIDAGACVDAFVVPGERVSHLDVTAIDDDGRIIGRGKAMGKTRSLIVCSPTRTAITLEIRPHAGRGLAAVVLSQTDAQAQADLRGDPLRYDVAPTAPLDEALRDLDDRLDSIGLPEASTTKRGAARVGSRKSLALDLPRGCSRLDVVGGQPTRGLEAWAWSSDNDLLAHSEGGVGSTLFVCHPGGPIRLDVEALSRGGPFAVTLRPGPELPGLTAQPLAASRLLGRLASGGLIRRVSDAGAPKKAALSPTHLATHEAIVPVGRCIDIVAALGTGATGVEIRLVDMRTNEELALRRGTHSAAARACALERPSTLEVRAEIRAAAGAADGLFTSRLSAPAR